MADKDTTHRFPYQHLAVLGVEKMKKYVPPPVNADARTSAPRLETVSTASTAGNAK
jgi:hypothetical protein